MKTPTLSGTRSNAACPGTPGRRAATGQSHGAAAVAVIDAIDQRRQSLAFLVLEQIELVGGGPARVDNTTPTESGLWLITRDLGPYTRLTSLERQLRCLGLQATTPTARALPQFRASNQAYAAPARAAVFRRAIPGIWG